MCSDVSAPTPAGQGREPGDRASRAAIVLSDLGKCYRMYRRPEDRLAQALWRRRRRHSHEFWALREVSLELTRGMTLGIVGENGSGKSTLLEIVAGTLAPSCGRCHVNGRVAALLELGTGFNPDFTGRENVFLQAAVVGLSRSAVENRYGEIQDFADIGEFINQPVKTYSNGMLLRLAFAVAVSVEPEILIVDEVLAVGDEAFQRKCFARLERIREGGATVLFASHDLTTILNLSDAVLLLDHGERLLFGPPKLVAEQYQRLLFAPRERRESLRREIRDSVGLSPASLRGESVVSSGRRPRPRFDPGLVAESTLSYEKRGAEIQDPQITTVTGEQVNVLVRGERYLYKYSVSFDRGHEHVRFGMLIKTKTGLELGGGASTSSSGALSRVESGTRYRVEFSFACRLLPGMYFLNAGVVARLGEEETYLHRLLDAVAFRVRPEGELHETGLVDFSIRPAVVVEPQSLFDPGQLQKEMP